MSLSHTGEWNFVYKQIQACNKPLGDDKMVAKCVREWKWPERWRYNSKPSSFINQPWLYFGYLVCMFSMHVG